VRETLLAAVGQSPAGFTDIRFHRRHGVRIAVRDRQVESTIVWQGTGGVVRCWSPGHAWGAASFGDPAELPSALLRAHELSVAVRWRSEHILPPQAARQIEAGCPPGRDPGDLADSLKQEVVLNASAALHATDRRIVESQVRYEDALVETWVVNSEGSCLVEWRPSIELAVLAVAEEEGTQERALGSVGIAGHWPDLEEWVGSVSHIAGRAVSLLRAVPLQPGRLPVVLDPASAGVLAHRAAAHLCHGDGGEEEGAPVPVGTRLGPPQLSIGDDGTVPGLRGTHGFDHEGLAPRNTMLVRNGVVVEHVHTRTSAALAGMAPTGNARGDWRSAPAARLTNTYLGRGQGDLGTLLRDVALGLYLSDPVAVTLGNGRAGLRGGYARMIRRGELAEPVRNAVVGGDTFALFGLIDAVAGDFRWDPSAARCSRGGLGTVAVSTGAPHVRLLDAPVGEPA
jgi:TldD protein